MPNLTYAKPLNTYSGLPVEEAKALNESQSKDYNTNRAAKDALDVLYNNLDVEDRNYDIKKKAIEGAKTKFQDLVAKGDYQNAKYAITDAVKSFQTDAELQASLKSRQKEQAYYNDLKNRLEAGTQSQTSTEQAGNTKTANKEVTKRSGGINKDIYAYAMEKTKAQNQGQIKYNPETGTTEGGFQGHNVVDDKSGDIYDEMYARTKDWKADSIDANGNTYTMSKTNPRGYLNVQTGKEVTKDEIQKELIKELSNRGDYKDFLAQERDIQRHKQIPNGDITPESFANLGYNEDKLKNTLLGIDDNHLKTLAKSKSVDDKKELARLQGEKSALDLHSFDKEKLTNLYDNVQKNHQLLNYTSAAAEKEAHTDIKNEFLKDEPYLMALDFGYKKKLKELENKMDVPMYPSSNYSIAKTLDKGALDKLSLNHEATQKGVNDIESQYGTNVNNMPADVKNKYSDLKADLKIFDNNTTKIYDDIDKKGGNIYGKVKETIFSGESPTDLRDFLNSTKIANPLSDKLNRLYAAWQANPTRPGFKGEQVHVSFNDIVKENLNDTDRAEMKGMSKGFETPNGQKLIEDYTHQVGINSNAGGLVKEVVEKSKNKYFENNEENLYQINTKVLADDKNPKSPVHQLTNKYSDLAKSGTDFKSSDDKSIPQLVNEYNLAQGKNGKHITMDNVKVNLTTQPILGKFALNVTMPDGKTDLLYPADQEDYRRNMYMLGDYLTNTGDNKEANIQGQDIKSHINFGDLRNELSAISSKKIGGVIPIDLPIAYEKGKPYLSSNKGRNEKFTLKVLSKNSDGTSIFGFADKDGDTRNFDLALGAENNKFANISVAINALQSLNTDK